MIIREKKEIKPGTWDVRCRAIMINPAHGMEDSR